MSRHSFDDIIGQTAAIAWLKAAYLADHLPHAIMFAGPAGVGKGTTADALAKLHLCENPNGAAACNVCESCRTFDGGNHPDCHVLAKEHIRYHDKTGKSKGIELSIHVIRPELVEPAGRKAVMGRGKVFIIEQAETMNAQAQNATLKTLEEPAGRTLIILLTNQPGALLPTIRSRCQTLRFMALDDDVVRTALTKRGINPSDAADAARLSTGSLGTALRWLEDGVVASAAELIRMLDGIGAGESADNLPPWFKAASEAFADRQLERDELSSKDQATREGLSLYLMIAANHIRQRFSADDAADQAHTCDAIDAIVKAELLLDANVNIALIFQQLALKLALAS